MERFGKVIEVYIPGEEVMVSEEIGFKVKIDDEIVDIVKKQDEFNVRIHREDAVSITKTLIDGREFIDIELVEE